MNDDVKVQLGVQALTLEEYRRIESRLVRPLTWEPVCTKAKGQGPDA